MNLHARKILHQEKREQADVRADVEDCFAACQIDAMTKVNAIFKNLLVNVFGFRRGVVKDFQTIRCLKNFGRRFCSFRFVWLRHWKKTFAEPDAGVNPEVMARVNNETQLRAECFAHFE
jgi:hypothetical protein